MRQQKSILVTGGAGFIGSNFIRHLYQQEENIFVRVLDKMTYSANLDNLREFMNRGDFEFLIGDICDPEILKPALKGINVVVNFAAEVAVDRSIRESQSFLNTDIFGVATLLNACMDLDNLERFIQISTDEVYGHILEGSFYESSELKPRNPYAASKLGGDRLAYSYYETYGLPVVITRASNNYGLYAYPEKVIPLFITNLFDGKKIPVFGDGQQIRDWLFVEDHCAAINLLISRGKDGEVYNVGGEQECTNLDLTRKILNLMGKDDSYINFVADRPGHDLRYSLNCDKLKNLGWSPKVQLDEGLETTVKWYCDHEQWWRPLKEKLDKRYESGFWGKEEAES